MRIIIDGDAAPSIDIIEAIGKKYNIEVIIFCDYAHMLNSDYSKIINVDCSKQSVDMKIANYINKDDILLTNDYGLALLGLSKNGYVISFNGIEYKTDTIDTLLIRRHNNLRQNKFSKIKKRSSKDDVNLINSLTTIINKYDKMIKGD